MVEQEYKQLNREQVQRAFDELLAQVTEPNKTYSVPISELHLGNSRITDAVLAMTVHSTAPSEAITIIKIKNGDNEIVSRDFLLGKVGSGDNLVTTITCSIVSNPLTEGAGIATAVAAQTDQLVEKTLELAQVPTTQDAIYVVTDRAKGQEKERKGWSSAQLEKLGFESDPDVVKQLSDLLSLQLTPEEMERTYYKTY